MVRCRLVAILLVVSPSFALKCYQDESTTDLGEADGWDNYPFICGKQAQACSITYNYQKRFMVRACQNTRCKTNGTETDKDMCTRISANRLECCCYGSACNFITPDGILVPFIKKGQSAPLPPTCADIPTRGANAEFEYTGGPTRRRQWTSNGNFGFRHFNGSTARLYCYDGWDATRTNVKSKCINGSWIPAVNGTCKGVRKA